MSKSFLIIGLGRFGLSTARTLIEKGHEVMAVDCKESAVAAVKDEFTHVACCDTGDENAVRALGVSEFDAVVVSIGSDLRASILTTLLCLENGAKYVVAKALDENHVKLLEKVGAHRVIQPEKLTGERIAQSLISTDVLDMLELSDEQSVMELLVPKAWLGKSIRAIDIRRVYRVSVIALRQEGRIQSYIDPDHVFKEGDAIFLIGDNRDLNRVIGLQ